ncbi:MAG: DUF2889 domain-containing protein [Candidatus Binatia bacterium]
MSLTPLHTRMISLRLVWGEADTVVADGRIFDLRKRGIVPMAGKLRGPGVVHDMAARLELEYPGLRIRSVEPSMTAFPFAAGPMTLGEGCSDRLSNVQHLVGRSLREEYGTVLTNEVGGPRGCFHLFTLLRLLGPTVEWAVERERSRRPNHSGAIPGSPIFARSIVMDAMKREGLRIALRGVLSDLHYPPGADALPLEEEMEESFETTAEIETEIPSMAIEAASGRVRRSGPGIDTVGKWEPVLHVGDLVGRVILKGYTAEVQAVFADTTGLEPVQHLLFMLAPALMQCLPSLVEELEVRPRRAESPHAAVDSCHMWRANGPLIAGTPWKPPSPSSASGDCG